MRVKLPHGAAALYLNAGRRFAIICCASRVLMASACRRATLKAQMANLLSTDQSNPVLSGPFRATGPLFRHICQSIPQCDKKEIAKVIVGKPAPLKIGFGHEEIWATKHARALKNPFPTKLEL
jgi:hypothetical protein